MNCPPVSFSNYRDFLLFRWKQAREENARVNQSAFARQLGLAPNRFSELLSGKQGLSPTAATRIADRLKLRGLDRTDFMALVHECHARSRLRREEAAEYLQERRSNILHRNLTPAEFAPIGEWHSFAILSLLAGTRLKAADVATRLSLSPDTVSETLLKLRSLGFARLEAGLWTATNRSIQVEGGIPSPAIRRFHRQLLKLAERSLSQTDVSQRHVNTLLVRASPERMAWVREKITALWREIEKGLESDEGEKRLYALAIQYFPLER